MEARTPFRRVLVANRGEIAIRIIRACQELGARAIAVYSDADRGALHTRVADEAHLIGPAPAVESYLNVDRILDVARRTGAEAIHPGYGFLSENPRFAEACAAAGIIFIGPPPDAMRLMGDKAAARRIAARHGVPVVPGYDGPEQDDGDLLERAREIGFPLLIKAAAGGGGRGMRVVAEPAAFAEALEGARREARAAFGDSSMVLERYIVPARHVEVQVVGDRFDALVHLGERECSVQRRHQKIVEESPSPAVSPELRARLGEAAVRVARAVGYQNAGTCEFLLDAAGSFYFIEMNARLQVEHPVTEEVTGIDLVRRQLAVAAGEPLGLDQSDIVLRGHAIECRVYAEDPERGFLPTSGRLARFEPPSGRGLRNDVGFASGDIVNTFYDAMLGKLIAYGEDRPGALERLRLALDRYVVEGVSTNLGLLRWIVDHPTFTAGRATTDFLARTWRPIPPSPAPLDALAAVAALELSSRPREPSGDPWQTLGPWRLLDEGIVLAYESAGRTTLLTAGREDARRWRIVVGDVTCIAEPASDGSVTVETDGRTQLQVTRRDDGFVVTGAGATHVVRAAGPPDLDTAAEHVVHRDGAMRLTAPMPGRVVKVAARAGDRVREHETLVVLEAMKIEHTVTAPQAGVVRAVRCSVGDTVDAGSLLLELADD